MALPSANFPATIWDGNEQSIANDVPGDDTRANGLDYNQASAEIIALQNYVTKLTYKTTDVDYIALVTDRVINVSVSGKEITLFTAVGNTGRRLVIDNASSGNITVSPDGAETIQGETSQTIPSNSSISLYSTGVIWRIY